MNHAFGGRTFSGLWVAALAAGAAETFWTARRGPTGLMPALAWLPTFAITTLVAFGFAVVLGAGLYLFGLSSTELRRRRPGAERGQHGLASAATAVLLVGPVLALATLAGRFLHTAFSNVELAALLSALLTLLAAALGGAAWLLLRGPLERLLERNRPSAGQRWLTLLILGIQGSAWIVLSARTIGLTQLNPGLAVSASAALAAFALGRRLPTSVAKAGALVSCALLLALSWSATSIEPSPFSLIMRQGSWSKAAIGRARALLDRDGDGYSAGLAGGDCNDRDPRVHPGAAEVARDGIDNDCAAGDARIARLQVGASPALEVPPEVPERPHLVLVTIETLRPDHLSLFGYARRTSPRLDELAASSLVFERAYAAAPATRLSLAALLSGRTPSSLRWLSQPAARAMRRIAPENPWLPLTLQRAGYRTLAVHTSFRAFTAVEGAGFDRGFDVYDTSTRLDFVGGTMRGFPGSTQIDRALALLDGAAEGPVFLWIHLVEPHYLYEQSPDVPSFGTDEIALYDAEIAEADRLLGRLSDGLRERAMLERTLLVVAGDHGEEFGEHGERFHTSNLYEPQVRTALVLRVPGLPPRRVKEAVVLTDLAPTLESLLRLPSLAFSASEGRNLLPHLLHGEPLTAGFFLENFRVDSGAQRATALVDWPFKLIYEEEGRTLELYDLERDPGERHNVYEASSATSGKLVDHLHARLESAAFSAAAPDR
jgi:arylsulfatase A-like enzyme